MFGLKIVGASAQGLQIDNVTSNVEYRSIPNDGSQMVEFDGGKLWNKRLQKYLSLNSRMVKADSNDTRGASDWILGKKVF